MSGTLEGLSSPRAQITAQTRFTGCACCQLSSCHQLSRFPYGHVNEANSTCCNCDVKGMACWLRSSQLCNVLAVLRAWIPFGSGHQGTAGRGDGNRGAEHVR